MIKFIATMTANFILIMTLFVDRLTGIKFILTAILLILIVIMYEKKQGIKK